MRYKFRTYSFDSEYVSCKDFSFLRLAAKVASISDHHRFRLGSVVVKSGRVLSQGVNVAKKSPNTPPHRESVHAEVNAIRGVTEPDGATVYVARLDSFDAMALAKPCEYCVSHMQANGIYRVVFSVSENDAESFDLDSVFWKGYKYKNGN
jgi:tRNA(Arg) A34 adenosine deaminase TadA